jgi:N-methylhydantoinase B/oxoprolinase/acetone carboxylase alpha subunit
MRHQELDGFVEGLFGQETSIDLPERATRGLDVLGEMRALVAAVFDMANEESKTATSQDIEAVLRNMREMTKIAEHEMHAVILACTRARRQLLATPPAAKPTLH